MSVNLFAITGVFYRHQIMGKSTGNKTLFLGGQFAPEKGGHFPPELGGQFAPEWVVNLLRNQMVTLTGFSNKWLISKTAYVFGDTSKKTNSCWKNGISIIPFLISFFHS